MSRGQPPVAIVGSTATGKTALAIDVALRLAGEIISMDSRQVYRGMDIGTAKATAEQRAAVPHFGLDLVAPHERFSAGRFARYARDRIVEIGARGHLPLLVGGTGFFLRALTHPIFREPELDRDRRAALAAFLGTLADDDLRRWLRAFDPPAAGRLERWGGRQRLLRALEMPLLTGRSLTWWHANAPPETRPLEPTVFVVDLPRPLLDRAIDDRVREMLASGLLDEVAFLLRSGYDERSPGMKATGYVELIPHLRGDVSLEEAVDAIRKNTRAYSRRQLTWFRNQLAGGAIWLDAAAPREALVERVVQEVRSRK
jgi:tRNA dimethylallyltransferase